MDEIKRQELDEKVSSMSHDAIVKSMYYKDSLIESLQQENESMKKSFIVDIERLEKDLMKNKEMCLKALEKLKELLG